ncbi:MAG: HAMP domain-containing histidine kinase [Thermoleophilia bacterium]|nr:HAMP domain-containing histidine kinase [Thermoleophilia bacterium]
MSSASAIVRSLAIGVLACLVGAAVIGASYDLAGARTTLLLLLPLAALVLVLAHWLAANRRRLGGLARQFRFGVIMVVGSILVSVWVAAFAMFLSHHDAVVVTVMATVIGAVALRVGEIVSRGVMSDVESLRDGLEAVGAGSRDTVVEVGGDDELAELAGSVNAMINRLGAEEAKREEADSARRRLVASVSHDLRTPLASLRLLVESIEDGVATGQTRDRYISQLRIHVSVLTGLVDDLFELSRIEAGDITWTMSRIELDSLVGDTVEAMRTEADILGVQVRAELPGDELLAEANPEKVQRVLFNLIQNAIRHTPADGSVTVRARSLSGEVEVEVTDEGSGIAPVDRPHVFEPFFRGGTDSSRTSEGAGLGLAISRAIVEAHGGRIWLEPADSGPGTRMRFTLRSPVPG